MKYSTRMVLIPETEYLSLKESSKTARKKKTLDLPARVVELTQTLGKQIRQQDQKIAKAVKPSLKIVEYLPPIYHAKANLLLKELDDAGIKYNNKRELVLKSGEVVFQSNIIDLIKESLIKSKRGEQPTGWQAFMEDVATSAVPVSLFKSQTRQELEQARRVPEYERY